jgi:hypothetical protein
MERHVGRVGVNAFLKEKWKLSSLGSCFILEIKVISSSEYATFENVVDLCN